MFCYGIALLLALFVVCLFFGGEFNPLGRHAWRCKEKLKTLENGEKVVNHNGDLWFSSTSYGEQ